MDTKPPVPPATNGTRQYTYAPIPAAEQEEELDLSWSGEGTIWAVKIPRFLLERWERVEEEGLELGTLYVDNDQNPPKITLRLPDTATSPSPAPPAADQPMNGSHDPSSSAGPSRPKRKYDTTGIPDEYELQLPNEERAHNTFVFSEKTRQWGKKGGEWVSDVSGKRKREKAHPKLIGRVDHEAMLKPVRSEKYNKVLERRQIELQGSRRPIIQLSDTGMSRGEMNQLHSGYANAISNFGRNPNTRTARVATEKSTRLEHSELTDRLFALFSEKPYWGITALRKVLNQPDAWLREVLREIAVQIKEGPYVNMWTLKEGWRDGPGGDVTGDVKADGGEGEGEGQVKEEGGVDGGDDDDDDDELEEIKMEFGDDDEEEDFEDDDEMEPVM